ncbi:MAG: SDR family oxidoreductase [Thermodesulfobacteriota bacterium]
MKKKLLLTGASGFLGWSLCRLALPHWEVFGIWHRQEIPIAGVRPLKADLMNFRELETAFRLAAPDAVIHAAAASKPDFCQQHPRLSFRINVEASATLADQCAAKNIPFVFTSTDLVFDGDHPPYSENSPAHPINVYGEQKLRAEEEIRQRYPATVICRLPLLFGYSGGVTRTFTEQMIRAIEEGRPLTLFTDEYRTPVDAWSAAEGLLLAATNWRGAVVHLGGKKRISRYEMGRLIETLLDAKSARITGIRRNEVSPPSPRPADVSLDSRKAFEWGYDPAALETALKRSILRYHNGFRPEADISPP